VLISAHPLSNVLTADQKPRGNRSLAKYGLRFWSVPSDTEGMRRWNSVLLTFAVVSFGLSIHSTGMAGEMDISSHGSAQQETQDNSRIRSALEILWRVPTGRALLKSAISRWKLSSQEDLLQVVRPGTASRTDAVLTRHYNPVTGQESREREVTVYVRQDQSLDNIVLDIAHEMVHATSRPDWDPYDPELTAGRYIKNSIEGKGGEVQAVTSECRVAVELGTHFGLSTRRCRSYISPSTRAGVSPQVDVDKIREDFYRVGKWSPELVQALGSEIKLFPDLSGDAPRLYSSTGNAPYPAALLREFQALTQIACENSRRRIDSLRVRTIASARESADSDSSNSASNATFVFLERRCQ
jgi:hypothetical protein